MSQVHWHSHFYHDSPIFEPVSAYAERLNKHSDWPTCQDLNELKELSCEDIINNNGQSIVFVPHDKNNNPDSFEQHYEPRIYLSGEVSTREKNWHDFFNALVWMMFPKTKSALNQIHFQALMQSSPNPAQTRGPLRDATTLFDESGVVVLSSQSEWITLLQEREWKAVFWQHRAFTRSSLRFIVFGHALYEKALKPYIGMTGKGIFFKVEAAFLQQPLTDQLKTVDRWLVDFVQQKLSSNADLSPIPILGYPGWYEANRHENFYDNRWYFRPL